MTSLLEKSTLRMRRLLLVLSVALLIVLSIVYFKSTVSTYRVIQIKSDPIRTRGIVTITPCTEEPERCTSCHMNATRTDPDNKAGARVYRSHGLDAGPHDFNRLGCVVCHGGEGRALDVPAAHTAPTLGIPDPLRKAPHMQAACAQCHVPGARKGQERLLEGAKLYAGLGCPVCHPLTKRGTGGLDYGPDIRTAGRRTPKQLETSLIEPTADFEGSTMPSFKLALNKAPRAFESLIIYLESLPLPLRKDCAPKGSQVSHNTPCAHCHAGSAPKPTGRMQHRCPFIQERKDELRCGDCHQDGIPPNGTECPIVKNQREACPVCHRD